MNACLAADGCTAAPLWLWEYRCAAGHTASVPHCAGCHKHELARRVMNVHPPCTQPGCRRQARMQTARQMEVHRG